MACGCKKNKKGKKTITTPTSDMNSKEMQQIIRKKIIEQIQKGSPTPKTSQ
tara:strand:- start:53 stop:205 length:153 start_codon:yes stop_codon:yes gene_type:complete